MGARLPLASYLQAFTIHDALGASLSFKEISFAIGSSDRAIVGVMRRVKSLSTSVKFTTIDQKLARQLSAESQNIEVTAQNFFGFCDAKSILVDENALIRFLDVASNTAMPEFVETYGRRGRRRS